MKFQILDYLRALGVILVTYGHVMVYGTSNRPFLGPLADSTALVPPEFVYKAVFASFCNIGEIGVSVFFLVSGFLIMKSRLGKPVGVFLVRRLQRIYPIAVVGIILSYLALMITNHYVTGTPLFPLFNREDVIALLTNSLLVNGMFPSSMDNPVFQTSIIVPTYWFLAVIVKYYILMCFIRNDRQESVLMLALILLVFSLSYTTFNNSDFLMGHPKFAQVCSDLAFSGHHIIYILVGCSIYLCYQEISSKRDSALNIKRIVRYCFTLLVLAGMFVLSFYSLKKIPNFPLPGDMLKNYFMSFCLFLFCLLISHYVKKVPRFIQLISDTSFSVYVLHYSIAACFLVALLRLDLFRENLLLLYATVFSLTWVSGWLLYKLVEEPVGRLKIKLDRIKL